MSRSKLVALMCPQCGAPLKSHARCEYCGVLFESDVVDASPYSKNGWEHMSQDTCLDDCTTFSDVSFAGVKTYTFTL